MQHKVALITGSSSGIGEATAIEFSKLDYHVVIHGTNDERIKRVSNRCKEVSPSKFEPLEVNLDLSDTDKIPKLVECTVDIFGRLDVLVNNAGIYQPTDIFDENTYQLYSRIMKVNMDQVVLLTSLAVPYLKKTKGNIVNVSSNLHFKPMPNTWAYSASKAAMVAFSRCLAIDLAPDIRVNVVSPGPVVTLIQERLGYPADKFKEEVSKDCLTLRVGEPNEVARAILFLASPESSFITGSDMVVDGGSSIKCSATLPHDKS